MFDLFKWPIHIKVHYLRSPGATRRPYIAYAMYILNYLCNVTRRWPISQWKFFFQGLDVLFFEWKNMTRVSKSMSIVLVFMGLFLLFSPSARAEPETLDEEEEESSCQGAFDLYFVLDK